MFFPTPNSFFIAVLAACVMDPRKGTEYSDDQTKEFPGTAARGMTLSQQLDTLAEYARKQQEITDLVGRLTGEPEGDQAK